MLLRLSGLADVVCGNCLEVRVDRSEVKGTPGATVNRET